MTALRAATDLAAKIDRDPGFGERFAAPADDDVDMWARLIDAHPGCAGADGPRADGRLAVRGYRLVWRPWPSPAADDPDEPDGGEWCWWPSRARCAELARTAIGERRETLLRGMLL